jgi:adenylate cyclase
MAILRSDYFDAILAALPSAASRQVCAAAILPCPRLQPIVGSTGQPTREPRMTMAALQQSRFCKGCWEQMHLPVPLRGVISAPFRAFGVRPSRMNPNTCTICELMFTKVMRARKITIDATIMFADLRGYTGLSQSQSPDAVSGLLDAFYDECANAIWEHDGLLNKTIGDAVMAVFNFPLRREEHARNAVLAARDIQQRWRDRREALVEEHGLTASELGIGIGIHSGELSFGEFGHSHRDLTAIGTVVNTASRAQSVAGADQILVTKAVFERAQPDLKDSPSKAFQLKGFDVPVELYAA